MIFNTQPTNREIRNFQTCIDAKSLPSTSPREKFLKYKKKKKRIAESDAGEWKKSKRKFKEGRDLNLQDILLQATGVLKHESA